MTDPAAVSAQLERNQAAADSLKAMLAGIEAGLADIVDGQDKRQEVFHRLLLGIETALADLVGQLEKGGTGAAAVADAIRQLKLQAPAVHVDAPTVTVEAVMPPAPQPLVHLLQNENATWEIEVLERDPGPGARGVKRMRITRKAGG